MTAMLFLLFHSGNQKYALAAAQVIAVVPRVPLRSVPGAPDTVSGLLLYRGAALPVLDFNRLCGRSPCPDRLSTRIMILPYQNRAGNKRPIGVMAEAVTRAVEKDTADFKAAGLAVKTTPFLGPLASDRQELIQRVQPDQLVSPELESLLFANQEPGNAPCR